MMRSSVVLPQPEGPTIAPTLPIVQSEGDLAQRIERLAGRADIGLGLDGDFKPRAVASGRHGVQRVAPRNVSIASMTPTKGSA